MNPALIVFALLFAANKVVEEPKYVELTQRNCPGHFQSPNSAWEKTAANKWRGTVTGWYYRTPTGIKVKKGQNVTIKATGTVCWRSLPWRLKGRSNLCERYGGRFSGYNNCGGPADNHVNAPGLNVEIGNKGFGFEEDDEGVITLTAKNDGSIVFVIHEQNGESVREHCGHYGDNCGKYNVEVTVSATEVSTKGANGAQPSPP